MDAKQTLTLAMDMGSTVLKTYISDLTDAELLTRPAKGANHLAWQLGHLISSEHDLVNMVCPDVSPELPAGFAALHSKESIGVDDPSKFLARQKYLELYDRQRQATQRALGELPEADLDKPGPKAISRLCPTVGAVFSLVGSHVMMHCGQFATARRLLGKPILI